MKKISLILVLLLSFVLRGYSAYLVNVPQEMKQPNGTILHCFASGDEFYSWLHDSLGYTIVENPETGFFVYALRAEDANLIASDYVAGVADPVALGLPVGIRISSEIIEAKRTAFEATMPPRKRQKAGNNTGTINNLVVFIRFADEEGFSNNFNFMEKAFNDSSSRSANSMYNYVRLASYGQLYIHSHFFPASSEDTVLSYQDIYPRSYYQPQSPSNPNGFTEDERTSREHALLKRAIQHIADSVPSHLNLDYDGDGRIDNVCFMVSGNAIPGGNILWPHRWSLYTGTEIYINGKRVYDYNLNLEFMYGDNTIVGVCTHEMMHTLDFPDLYRYSYDGMKPVDTWDLMAQTNYRIPQGLGAHMKSKYGKWIPELPEIIEPGTYTLYPANDSAMIYNEQNPIGYKIRTSESVNEYIVLEYRKMNEVIFENNLYGSGILIYRINSTRDGNANANGTTRPDEVYIYRPGGAQLIDGNVSQAHFSADIGRTLFDEETNPYPFLSNGNTINDIVIRDITVLGDSIRFTFMPKGEFLSINKTLISFGSEGGIDSFSVVTNTPWEITGVDSSWLGINTLSGDSGTTTVQVSTRTQNSFQVPRNCVLTISYGSKTKSVAISQGIAPLEYCKEISNTYAEDTLFGYDFQQYGIYSVAEYFSANGIQVLDSVSFYFGDVNPVDSGDNTIKLEICVANASMFPGTVLSTQTISFSDLKPNQWNTIKLLEPVILTRGFTVGYSFAANNSNFLGINVFKNALLRTEAYNGTMIVRQDGAWKKSSETSFPEIKNYSLAAKLSVCPPSPNTDTLLVSTLNIPMSYDSNVQAGFDITSNTSWEIMRIPEGYAISQSNGSGDAHIIITTLNKSLVARHTVYFYVRSGSIVHRIVIERASHPLISNKKAVELNYQGTDSVDVYITATGTDWEARLMDNSFFRVSRESGTAGTQRIFISPIGANNTNYAFEGCLNIVSTSLNESICIVVRQNSIVGIKQAPTNSTVFSLYPNPANSQLWIKSDNIPIYGIVVYDMIGKEVLKVPNVNDIQTVLDISTLTQGVYILKIKSEQGEQVRKFIKN